MLRLALLPAVLAAAWGPPQVIARDGEPKAAVERADGSLTVLADTGAATTFTWPAGARVPLRAAVGPITNADPWFVNARGDALLVDTYPPRALAVDVSGTRAEIGRAHV